MMIPPSPLPGQLPFLELEWGRFETFCCALVGRLPVEQRAPIVLRECAALDYDQIAIVLNCTRNEVAQRIYAAREQIRRILDEVAP